MGFANKLTISRDVFDWERNFYTSKQCTRSNKSKEGTCLKYVHVRAVVAFREIGRGLEAIKPFS